MPVWSRPLNSMSFRPQPFRSQCVHHRSTSTTVRRSARTGHHCTQEPRSWITHVDDHGISDRKLIITSLVALATNPRPTCESFIFRNTKNVIFDAFRTRMLVSDICTAPKTNRNDFTSQLLDDVIRILDEIVQSKRATKRCSKSDKSLYLPDESDVG